MSYTVWVKKKKLIKTVFLASNCLIFVSNRFAMLHIFYNQLRSGAGTESCLWHLKGCSVLVIQASF